MQRYAKGLQLRDPKQDMWFQFKLKCLRRSLMSGSQVYYHKKLGRLFLDIDTLSHLNGENAKYFTAK